MKIKNKKRKIFKVFLLFLFVIIFYNCNYKFDFLNGNSSKVDSSTDDSSTDDSVEEQTTAYDIYLQTTPYQYSGNSSVSESTVTNEIPNDHSAPLFFDSLYPVVYMVNDRVYLDSNGEIYESTLDSDNNWVTNSLGLSDIGQLIADNNYLYCIADNNIAFIYDPVSHSNICSVDLDNILGKDYERYMLECVGNGKSYFSAYRNSDSTYIIFSLNQDGQINIEKTDTDYELIPFYNDQDYFVYAKRLSDGTEQYVYSENVETGAVSEIYNQATLLRTSPVYRWNNSIIFLTTYGVCVADANGDGYKVYTCNEIHGYTFYNNKIYFTGAQLVAYDLESQEQTTYDFGTGTDFTGNINACNGYIFLARQEHATKYLTVHVIPIS